MGTIHNILVEGQACNHILKFLISPFKAFKWIIAGTQIHYGRFGVRLFIIRQNMNSGF